MTTPMSSPISTCAGSARPGSGASSASRYRRRLQAVSALVRDT